MNFSIKYSALRLLTLLLGITFLFCPADSYTQLKSSAKDTRKSSGTHKASQHDMDSIIKSADEEQKHIKSNNNHAESLKCATCHACDIPTKENPCLRTCPRHAARNNTEESINLVADVFLLHRVTEGTDHYGPVIFPHKLHAAMEILGGKENCKECHHYNPEDKILACHKCHGGTANPQNLAQPSLRGAYHRQCMGCHREWSHESGCTECHVRHEQGKTLVITFDPTDYLANIHPNVTVPNIWTYKTEGVEEGPLVTFYHREHVELYDIGCAECHRGENCDRCHDITSRAERPRKPVHEDCDRCHEITRDCSHCHASEQRPGFDHFLRSGFHLKDYHADMSCRKCHSEAEKDTAGYMGLSADCTSCHGNKWANEGFDHKIASLILDDDHSGFECENCHTQGVGEPVSCDACHDDDRKFPASVPGHLVAPMD
jgi:Class III cytochrome C family/Cytochrome c3